MKQLFLYILFLSILFISCHNERKEREKQIAQLVNEWQGKQIIFPDRVVFTKYLTDTTDFQIPQSKYKVLVYIDSIGCTSCKLQLHKWKELIEYTDSVTNGEVPFLFFLHPKDVKEIHYLLKRDGFDHPVCIDMGDELNGLNKFPADITFQTFLLNEENKVLVLGSPVGNPAVKNLYLKQITGKDNTNKNVVRTTAEADRTSIDFGKFNKSETKEAIIEIKNTGDGALIITDVSTSCGCIVATYDKQPANSGTSLRVSIKMTPKEIGFFSKVITIRYNSIKGKPIIVNVRGYVE